MDLLSTIDKEKVHSPFVELNVPALKHDGGYHTISVGSSEELTFLGMRFGAKNQAIFEFLPVDGQHVKIEYDDTKVFTAFPQFEDVILGAMLPSLNPVASAAIKAELSDLNYRVGNAFRTAIIEFSASYFSRKEREAKDAEARAAEEQRTRYAANPLWGSM